MGRIDEARASYRRALELDLSYRTAFNSAGRDLYDRRQLDAAAREYRKSLALDPQEAFALLGLGQVALRRRKRGEAEAFFRQALAANSDLPDAERELGKLLARQRRTGEAIGALERALKLTLKGHKAVAASSFSLEGQKWVDPYHAEVHLELASLYAARGAFSEAINAYRFGIAAGGDGVAARCRLAWTYCRTAAWKKALIHAGHALLRAPKSAKRAVRRQQHRMLWWLATRRTAPYFAAKLDVLGDKQAPQ